MAAEAIFEGLVDKQRSPDIPFRDMALAFREEAWDRSGSIERVHRLGQQLADFPNLRLGVADVVRRAQALGRAHLFFWEAAPYEAEIRALIAEKQKP